MSKTLKILLIVIIVLAVLVSVYLILKRTLFAPKPSTEEETTSPPEEDESLDLSFDQEEATSDPFNDPQGPFYHQVFKSSSNDGLTFTKTGSVVFDKASVPDIIRLDSGRLIIYAVDGAKRSKSGLMVAVSDDNGENWQAGSLQFVEKSTKFAAADPEAVILDDGKIRLYYMVTGGSPGKQTSSTPLVNKILSATSEDGINFDPEEGTRFEYQFITDPDVVKIGERWFMYLSQGPKLIALESNDGLNFELIKTIREGGSVSNTVNIGEGNFRQFYCHQGLSIKSAVSNGGLSWKVDEGDRLERDSSTTTICDPAPIKLENKWLMFYKVAPSH